ncbi:hypothetical protein [Flavobacterium sp.]|uniref:hypothetical protein n=1 Tax=Flavobacterium sp. TaxID=239 RepID=UPI0026190599|nr:hypothetical protein [Flavobacterium sp.]MDD2986485.1 hypothetical protein [Flavobacterium sp.]
MELTEKLVSELQTQLKIGSFRSIHFNGEFIGHEEDELSEDVADNKIFRGVFSSFRNF